MRVTREMGFVREVVDHICFTDRGVIVEHGPQTTFFDNASDPRTRELLSQILEQSVGCSADGWLDELLQPTSESARGRIGLVDGEEIPF